MKKYSAFIVLIFISCTNQFVKQPSKLDISDVSLECQDLIKLVNEYWYKHLKEPCHKDFLQSYNIANKYKTCFIGLHKADILMILGEPDIKSPDRYEYVFKKKCGREESMNYSVLILSFSDNSLTKVESELRSIVE